MTSVVANTGPTRPDYMPPISIGGDAIPEGDHFSDHLDRQIERQQLDSRDRSVAEDRQSERTERKEPVRDEDKVRHADTDESEKAPVRDAAESDGRAEVPDDERRPESSDKQTETAESRPSDERKDTRQADGESAAGTQPKSDAAPEQPSAAVAKPSSEALVATTPEAVQQKPSATDPAAVTDAAEVVAATTGQPAVAATEAAAKESLPRIRKTEGRAQVQSLANVAAQQNTAQSQGRTQAAASGPVGPTAGDAAGKQTATNQTGPQQITVGSESGQFAGVLQQAAAQAPATQPAQVAAPPLQPLGDAMSGLGAEVDGKSTGQPVQASNHVAAAKAAAAVAKPQGPAGPASVQVAFELNRTAQQGLNRLSMQLHPAELGRVDVRIEVGHDGRALAVVMVDKQETLDMLQRDSRTLERALSDAGLQTDSGSLQFSLRQDPGSGETAADGGQGGGLGDEADAAASDGGDGDLPKLVSDRALDISV